MTLLNTAYLLIDDGSKTATFELSTGLEYTSTLTKNYLMGSGGQFIREFDKFVEEIDLDLSDSERRTGFWLDGGGGEWTIQLDFQTGLENVTWGDGSGGDGPENVTQTDASGADVEPLRRLQVLQFWIAKSRSDSFAKTRLYWGEWTDDTVPGTSGGVYERPMPVAVIETEFSKPEDDPNTFEGTLTLTNVAMFPATEAELADWAKDTTSQLGPILPTYLSDP